MLRFLPNAILQSTTLVFFVAPAFRRACACTHDVGLKADATTHPTLAVKRSHQCSVSCDMAVHGFQEIRACSCRGQIEFLVERKNFEGVVVRDWDVLWRTRRPVPEISVLSGKAVGLMAAVRQIRAGRGNIFRKLIG